MCFLELFMLAFQSDAYSVKRLLLTAHLIGFKYNWTEKSREFSLCLFESDTVILKENFWRSLGARVAEDVA